MKIAGCCTLFIRSTGYRYFATSLLQKWKAFSPQKKEKIWPVVAVLGSKTSRTDSPTLWQLSYMFDWGFWLPQVCPRFGQCEIQVTFSPTGWANNNLLDFSLCPCSSSPSSLSKKVFQFSIGAHYHNHICVPFFLNDTSSVHIHTTVCFIRQLFCI